MDKIDAVIVGGGLSGLSCAYKLADSGMQVIVLERGDFSGSKNVTGGRFYLGPVLPIIGDMFEDAPFERKISRERWTLMGDDNSISIDFTGENYKKTNNSFVFYCYNLDVFNS